MSQNTIFLKNAKYFLKIFSSTYSGSCMYYITICLEAARTTEDHIANVFSNLFLLVSFDVNVVKYSITTKIKNNLL